MAIRSEFVPTPEELHALARRRFARFQLLLREWSLTPDELALVDCRKDMP